MPARDPKSGKPLSGAAKRKRAKVKTTAYAKAAATSPDPVPTYKDFAVLSDAPVGKPEGVAWSSDVALLALQQVIRDPALANTDRWRWIKDLTAVIGMSKDKSRDERLLKQIAEQTGLAPSTAKAAGAKPLAGIAKPKTARRA